MKRSPQRLLFALVTLPLMATPAPAQEGEEGPVTMEADRISLDGPQVQACGNVRARRGETRMAGDRATYRRDTGWVDLEGNIRVRDTGYEATAPSARLNQETGLGEIREPRLHLLDSDAWILGERLERYAPERFRMDNAMYTACAPDAPPWALRSGTINVNQESSFAHHWNTRLELAGWPVLYTPYFGHYTDEERHTGFLYPSVEFSGSRGTDITVPFYWNIAPQMDATIGLRNMTAHGLMPQVELRHLGEDVETRLYGEHLANDKVTGDDRYYYAAEQRGTLPGEVSYLLDAERVSDPEYLSLFGRDLDRGSQRYLPSVLSLSRSWGNFRTDASFSYLQDLQDFNAPDTLQELPRLSLQGDQPLFGTLPGYLELEGEYVNFYREEGERYHRSFLDPSLSLPLDTRYGSIEPRAGVHATAYRGSGSTPGTGDRDQTRTLPHFSLRADSRVHRIWNLDGGALRHSIEPELFYLYIPYEDQDELPVLDTKDSPLRFDDLFEMNRFSGIDRINDANQLTTALTNRVDAKRGQRHWEAGLLRLGQIHYFQDRRVTLDPGTERATSATSNYFAEFGLRPIPEVALQGALEYDPDRPAFALNQMDYFQSQLTASHPSGHRFSARYLARNAFTDGSPEPVTEEYRAAAQLDLGPSWDAFGSYRYSALNREPLEQEIGLDYHAGCWGVRLAYQDRLLRRSEAGERDTTVYLTVRLRTLGEFEFGTDPSDLR
ncbi:MAG: LPS-assembly protein LptD [Thiohalorhabdus sp.]|uniref:LPS-assembly protein LptD n=1 Tax=Thiohalorhabdus sp. TaxID=3094134 RepID=UPI0039810746